jgi:hypothetical protein
MFSTEVFTILQLSQHCRWRPFPNRVLSPRSCLAPRRLLRPIWTRWRYRRALHGSALGFEIVQSIYPGWKFSAADTISANGVHGALLIGPRQPYAPRAAEWQRTLSSFMIDLNCDDRSSLARRGPRCPPGSRLMQSSLLCLNRRFCKLNFCAGNLPKPHSNYVGNRTY